MDNILLMGRWNGAKFVVTQKETLDEPCEPRQSSDLTLLVCSKDNLENGKKLLVERAKENVKYQLEYFSQGYNLWQSRLKDIE